MEVPTAEQALDDCVAVVPAFRGYWRENGWYFQDEAGSLAITKVTLRPVVRYSGEKLPTGEDLARLHDQAHHDCFIANSVKTEVVVEPH